MPYKGHKSVTIREKDYEFFMDLWEQQKEELLKKGVRSFGAFVTMTLYQGLYTQKLIDGYNKLEELKGKTQVE